MFRVFFACISGLIAVQLVNENPQRSLFKDHTTQWSVYNFIQTRTKASGKWRIAHETSSSSGILTIRSELVDDENKCREYVKLFLPMSIVNLVAWCIQNPGEAAPAKADETSTTSSTLTDASKRENTPTQSLPLEFKGKFFVWVDDAATIYVKGRHVHQASIGLSTSSETTVKLGDCITVNLINVGGPRTFMMAFLTTDKKYVISFRQGDCRQLWDAKKPNLTQREFDQLKQPATKERAQSAVLPFSTTSDWIWGDPDNCWLTAILTKDMITRQEP